MRAGHAYQGATFRLSLYTKVQFLERFPPCNRYRELIAASRAWDRLWILHRGARPPVDFAPGCRIASRSCRVQPRPERTSERPHYDKNGRSAAPQKVSFPSKNALGTPSQIFFGLRMRDVYHAVRLGLLSNV